MPDPDVLSLAANSLCRGWVRAYTAGLPAEERERRIAEIESDVWEQTAEPAPGLVGAARRSAHVVLRMLLGIPADLSWSTEVASRRVAGRRARRWALARSALLGAAPIYALAGVFAAIGGLPGRLAAHQPVLLIGSTLALGVVLLGAWLIPRWPWLGAVVGLPGLIWLVDLLQFALQ